MNITELDLTQKEYVFSTVIENEALLNVLEDCCRDSTDRMANSTNVKADNNIIYDTSLSRNFIHVHPDYFPVLNDFTKKVEEYTLEATALFNEQHPNHRNERILKMYLADQSMPENTQTIDISNIFAFKHK